MLPLLLLACAPLDLDPVEAWPHVVYDPSGGEVPTPNDLLFDEASGRLDLPVRDDTSPADAALRAWLGGLDGWPTVQGGRFTASEAIDPTSVTAATVTVWERGTPARRVPVALSVDGATVSFDAPVGGWAPGGRYLVVVSGVTTVDGAPLQPDAVMTWLRDEVPLDDPAHDRAFPGATRDERLAAGATLEATRARLSGWFDDVGVAADDVAAAFDFRVTTRAELALDRATQRVPLPLDLLRDAQSGLVELAPHAEDTALEAEAKRVANTLRGFGLSADPFFEVTQAVDPATATPDTVQLWALGGTPTRLDAGVEVMAGAGAGRCRRTPADADCRYVFVRLRGASLPLAPGATYAVVVTDGLHDLQGRSVVAMPAGALLTLDAPVAVEGRSAVPSLGDADARQVEAVRGDVDVLLDAIGRGGVAAAWTFTTMDPFPALEEASHRTERMGLAVRPRVTWRRPASSVFTDDALSELFPGGLNPAPAFYQGRVAGVREVISGTLPAPDFLDDTTRRETDTYAIEDLPFWAMTPEGYSPQRRLPVLIFGHAIVTDRRFQLMVASELVARGFVVIGVDWPYHGERTACVEASLVAIPNFFPEGLQPVVGFEEDLIWLPPCASGEEATCGPRGACLDARGRPEPFTTFPVIDMKSASGAAFMDTMDIPHIPDHFRQALTDLSTLVHSLRTEDWEGVLGQRVDPDQLYFAGQSLGSIIGSVWVASRDDVQRSVFNVPGSNLVDLFMNSTYFRPQMDQLFVDLDVPAGSFEQERLLQVASWLVDTVDPHSVGHRYALSGHQGLLQMDKVDADTGDLIIPNFTTENLQRLSGLPMITYPSPLHADLIVPVLGDDMLRDMAAHLGGVSR